MKKEAMIRLYNLSRKYGTTSIIVNVFKRILADQTAEAMPESNRAILSAKDIRDIFEDPLHDSGTVCPSSVTLTSRFHSIKMRIAIINENCPIYCSI